jgi:hypothetical protein
LLNKFTRLATSRAGAEVIEKEEHQTMTSQLGDILKTIGSSAAIIFAAWIFMGFLQQRYDAAVDRYRSLIGELRRGDVPDATRRKSYTQIMTYRRRCSIMTYAFQCGLVSAILLLLTLITGELSLIFPSISPLQYVSLITALLGFTLVIVSTALVMMESFVTRKQLDQEMADVPDLTDRAAP